VLSTVRRLSLVASVALAGLVPAAPAGAVVVTVEAHGADSAFWNPSLTGVSGAMPADGQITVVRVKGSVVDDPVQPRNPNPLLHFQVLRPLGDGRVQVDRSSAGFKLPITAAEAQPTSSYEPVNFCVRKGDFVDFNDVGGHEWSWGRLDGMHVQVFNRSAPGSDLAFYTKNNGTNNGAVFAPNRDFQGGAEELLMQAKLATGPDATDMCLGGYRQHVFGGVGVAAQTQALSVSKRSTRVKGSCPGKAYGSCNGQVTLNAIVDGKRVRLGATNFKLDRSTADNVTISLSDAATAIVRHAGRPVLAVATVISHDDPGSDGRAALNRPPVQFARSVGPVTLKVDSLLSAPKDGDGDGASDAWERAHGLDPKHANGTKDPDRDALSNVDEYRHGTDPKRRDSDRDGHPDGTEVSARTDPLDELSPPPPADSDLDRVPDARDDCPAAANPGQARHDDDVWCDACDADDDGDRVPDSFERRGGTDPLSPDTDHDKAGDGSDNCPVVANPQQGDLDGDGAGDACDPDDDDDSVPDEGDNCPAAANRDQSDADQDGAGDACDPDDDGDGVADGTDNCPFTFNPDQIDLDGDGHGDVCEPPVPKSLQAR
jgi:hypothetical protein